MVLERGPCQSTLEKEKKGAPFFSKGLFSVRQAIGMMMVLVIFLAILATTALFSFFSLDGRLQKLGLSKKDDADGLRRSLVAFARIVPRVRRSF